MTSTLRAVADGRMGKSIQIIDSVCLTTILYANVWKKKACLFLPWRPCVPFSIVRMMCAPLVLALGVLLTNT